MGRLAKIASLAIPEAQRSDLENQFPETLSQRLLVSGIAIEPQALRIDFEDIQRVYGHETIRSTSQRLPELRERGGEQIVLPLNHPIEQIIYRVLVVQLNAKASHIWNLLRQECNSDADPIYDIDAIIDTITPTTLTWVGRDETEKSMSYDSFRKNAVNSVRRFIRVEHERSIEH